MKILTQQEQPLQSQKIMQAASFLSQALCPKQFEIVYTPFTHMRQSGQFYEAQYIWHSLRIVNQRFIIQTYMIEIIIGLAIALAISLYFLKRTRKQLKPPSDAPQDKGSISPQPQTQPAVTDSTVKGENKKKKKKKEEEKILTRSGKQLEEQYPKLFYGVLSLKAAGSMSQIEAVALKNSKVLVSTSKNELVFYDLRKWKKDSPCNQRYFTSLDNNTASALAIGSRYLYAALDFDKTIAYYEFLGGQKGVYFKQICRFPRNLYKSQLCSLHVSDSEKFVIGTGSGADTVVNVWSMSGQKLAQVNTYQIQHYGICYGADKLLVRGWTSEVKLFHFATDKQGNFLRIEKSHHLTHSQQATHSAIDNLGIYAVTICKSDTIKLWTLFSPEGHLTHKTIDSYRLGIDNPQICGVHTLQDDSDRMRTFVIVVGNSKAAICDQDLNLLETFEGVEIQKIHLTGTSKNVVLGTYSSSGKLVIWNISSLLEKIQPFVLP